MGGRTKKSTKKFEKNHLKDEIDRRKEFAKIKQRQQVKAKRKLRNAQDNAKASDVEEEISARKQEDRPNGQEDPFTKMSVDEFFQEGFQLPEKKKSKPVKRGKEEKQSLGKRKRETAQAESDNASEASDSVVENEPLSEVGSVSEDDLELETHKGDLEALAEKDPEFYEYLKENDAELLDFSDNPDFVEVDQLSEGDETPQKPVNKENKGVEIEKSSVDEGDEGHDSLEVTVDLVNQWKIAISDQHSLGALRQVVLAFKAAANISADDGKLNKYTISSPDAYHQLLVVALEQVPTALGRHLPAKEYSSGKVRVTTDAKKYRKLSPLLKSYASSVQYLLGNLSDAPTINLTLSSLMPFLPYLLSFRKIVKALTKTVVDIWSESSSSEVTRINAFLLIRRLTVISDASIREAILKTAYQGLVRGGRTTNTHTLAGINLMKNSAAELWGLDPVVGYTTGFTYIRQLAVHLRTSTTHPGKETYKTIYNWQYTHSLDFWSRALAAHCSPQTNPRLKTPQDSALHPLIYPLVQIITAAIRLVPTPVYFPLRFHLIRALVRLSRATNTYIPLAPPLLEILNSSELSRPPKPSTLTPLDFSVVLHAPKAYLRTRVYQDGLGAELSFLLAEFFACWSKNIAFPELALPPMVMMKRWLKNATSTTSKPSTSTSANHQPDSSSKTNNRKGPRNTKVAAQIALVVQKMDQNAQWIEERRSQVTFTPSQREEVDAFLRDVPIEETPLGAFVVGMRAQREERERVLEEGRKAQRDRDQDRNHDGDDRDSGEDDGRRGGKKKWRREEKWKRDEREGGGGGGKRSNRAVSKGEVGDDEMENSDDE